MIRRAVPAELPLCLALRRTVFIEEQGVSEADEVDGLDDSATHLLAFVDGAPAGTARLLQAGDTGKIGRVCVLPMAPAQLPCMSLRLTWFSARIFSACTSCASKNAARRPS